MQDQSSNRLNGLRKAAWLVWLCLVLFATACVAESAHFHPQSDAGEQHCSLCIAAHSVARPSTAIGPVAAPTQCLGVLFVGEPVSLEDYSVLGLYIRPPPAR
jgi:hypothetical protein